MEKKFFLGYLKKKKKKAKIFGEYLSYSGSTEIL